MRQRSATSPPMTTHIPTNGYTLTQAVTLTASPEVCEDNRWLPEPDWIIAAFYAFVTGAVCFMGWAVAMILS